MSINPLLLDLLVERLGVSRRRVYQLIAEREATLVLPREQAALALALESGLRIGRFATPEDYEAVRQGAGRAAPAVRQASPQRKTRAVSATRASRRPRERSTGKSVFVVHGRNLDLRRSLFRFLRALGLEPLEWNQALKETRKGSPYVGEVLDAALEKASAVVVLISPDDETRLKPGFRKGSDPSYESVLTGQARPNVLFEAGMAFGRHPDTTILVQVGESRPFSDIGGRHVVHLDNHIESRTEFAAKLQAAGCEVDTSGTDWLSEGDFSQEAAD